MTHGAWSKDLAQCAVVLTSPGTTGGWNEEVMVCIADDFHAHPRLSSAKRSQTINPPLKRKKTNRRLTVILLVVVVPRVSCDKKEEAHTHKHTHQH